ncbi:hypothetical protein ACS0TY_010153 [Phlomoides rotata]
MPPFSNHTPFVPLPLPCSSRRWYLYLTLLFYSLLSYVLVNLKFLDFLLLLGNYLFLRFIYGCEKSEDEFDILTWWKVNTIKYTVLSKVARDVLAISVSTIASESAFSTSGRVIEPYRSSLSPTVEALICAQDWLRVASSSIDLHSIMEDIDQFEDIEKVDVKEGRDEYGASVILLRFCSNFQ